MNKTVLFNWNRADEIMIKLKDGSGRIIYKSATNINDTKKLADVFLILEKYGQDLDELYNEIKQRRDNIRFYNFTPEEKSFWF